MSRDEALERFRQDQFFDDDVVRCTGLGTRSWRELIRLRAVRTTSQPHGRGHVRTCNRRAFKRAAVIAALHDASLSLAIASYVAHALPFHSLLYEIVDPDVAVRRGVDVKRPTAHWFDPKRPARLDPASDWIIAIYQRRFVGAIYDPNEAPLIFGDLRNDAASFVAWWPISRRPKFNALTRKILRTSPAGVVPFASQWEDARPWRTELAALGYVFERHEDDQLARSGEALVQNPVVISSVNISFAIRIAIRRYLDLDACPGARTR